MYATVTQLIKMLANLDRWLEEAEATAKDRDFDVDRLLHARLSMDMFSFDRQVQSACDTAKFVGSRLTGGEAPSHPDTEKTLAELRERVRSTREYLQSLDEAAFEGAEDRKLFLPFLKGGYVTGEAYVREFAIPNFYFHATTAYALLRHHGVKLGKMTFIGGMDVRQP
ncbi:MAG: DUF1993 domain-containing protein [Myxococcota bacterium]